MSAPEKTTIESPVCLVAVSEYGELGAMLPLARDIETKLGLHPVFVFASGYGKVPEHGQLVELQGHSWLELGGVRYSYTTQADIFSEQGYFPVIQDSEKGPVRSAIADTHPALTLSRRIRADLEYQFFRIKRRLFVQLKEKDVVISGLWLQIQRARKIFDRLDVRLIVSGQDYALSVTSILAHEGAKRNIELAIVPYSMPPTTREIVESHARLQINRVPKRKEKFYLRHFSCWLMQYRGHIYSRLGIRDMLLADRFGLTPPLPWTPNSGLGKLLLPSDQARDYYIQSGVPADMITVTGAPWNDDLLALESSRSERKQRLLNRIRSELKATGRQAPIDTDKLVIVSWPPNQWPRASMGCSSYADLCRQFIANLASIQIAELAYVAISLHPTVSDPSIVNGLRRAGIVVLRDNLIDVIDCADVFSSTVSSTAFWAIQCGIPSINFDGYLYGYREFDEAGATTVRTAGQMRGVMDRLLSDEAAYAEAQNAIIARRDYWTVRSGESKAQIMEALVKMVSAGENNV